MCQTGGTACKKGMETFNSVTREVWGSKLCVVYYSQIIGLEQDAHIFPESGRQSLKNLRREMILSDLGVTQDSMRHKDIGESNEICLKFKPQVEEVLCPSPDLNEEQGRAGGCWIS